MSDPCDQGCRASGFFQNGTFVYNCPDLIKPAFFGLTTYNLTISYTFSSRTYSVLDGSGKIVATFLLDSSRVGPIRFIISSQNLPYFVTTDNNRNVLVISLNDNDSIIWRIGAGRLQFSSCLLISTKLACQSENSFKIAQFPSVSVVFRCPVLVDSTRFGLANYTLNLLYKGVTAPNEQEYEIYVQFIDSISILAATATLDNTGAFIRTVANDPRFQVSKTISLLTLKLAGGPTWKLLSENLNISAVLFLPNSFLGGMPLPQPPPSPAGCPTLSGELFLTADGKQLCQTNFTVTFYNQVCPDCPEAKVNYPFVSQERKYVFYCTDILRVVRGTGSTLKAKADALTTTQTTVTTAGLATYGMLRLMLSFLLFGRFDINFLRQCYYKRFLEKLSKSGFCAYKQLFLDSPYWKYFIE